MESHSELRFSGFDRRESGAHAHVGKWSPSALLQASFSLRNQGQVNKFFRGTFFARLAAQHALFTLVSKQFLDFASLKDQSPFNRAITCGTLFAEKRKKTPNIGFFIMLISMKGFILILDCNLMLSS